MPRGDGTGPIGLGPMTGRGMGYCAGFTAPGYVNCGFGRGRGRGFRNMYYMTGLPGWVRPDTYPYGPQNSGTPAPDVTAGRAPFARTATGMAPVKKMETVATSAAEAEADTTPLTKEALQNQIASLKKQLSQVREQLKTLEEEE